MTMSAFLMQHGEVDGVVKRLATSEVFTALRLHGECCAAANGAGSCNKTPKPWRFPAGTQHECRHCQCCQRGIASMMENLEVNESFSTSGPDSMVASLPITSIAISRKGVDLQVHHPV
jgi:hypothetical protein